MPIEMRDLSWAAGFIEGEGSFFCTASAGLSASQANRAPLDRLQKLFGGSVGDGPKSRLTKKKMWKWTLTGPAAVGVMMTIYSLMSSRHDQVRATLAKWKTRQVSTKFRKFCNRGHEYTEANTVRREQGKGYPHGARYCRTCLEDRHILKRRA